MVLCSSREIVSLKNLTKIAPVLNSRSNEPSHLLQFKWLDNTNLLQALNENQNLHREKKDYSTHLCWCKTFLFSRTEHICFCKFSNWFSLSLKSKVHYNEIFCSDFELCTFHCKLCSKKNYVFFKQILSSPLLGEMHLSLIV